MKFISFGQDKRTIYVPRLHKINALSQALVSRGYPNVETGEALDVEVWGDRKAMFTGTGSLEGTDGPDLMFLTAEQSTAENVRDALAFASSGSYVEIERVEAPK